MKKETLQAIHSRRSTRSFAVEDVDENLLKELLLAANRAPSGFNLQPWHFLIVQDPALKQIMAHIAMDQKQVVEAPYVVVFIADPNAWKTTYKDILNININRGAINEERAEIYRKSVNLLFKTGPFGLFGLIKRITIPLHRFLKPTPTVITSKKDAVQYVRSHTMLAAATFMIAAEGAGLSTCPMEGFDEERLKKLLAIPKNMSVPIIIPVGYASQQDRAKQTERLPLSTKVSFNLFHKKIGD